MKSLVVRSKSDLHLWNEPVENNRYFESRDCARGNAHRSTRAQSFGLAIGPNEIEIDLKMKDSQMIFQHLAALCGDMKKPNKHKRNGNIYGKPIGDYPRNRCQNSRSRSFLSERIANSGGDQKCNPSALRSRNGATSLNRSDQEHKTPTKRSTIWDAPSSCRFSLQSYIDKQIRNKERDKKHEREIRTLRKICEKKGKKFVKDFEMKEKIRRKADQVKYNALKKDLLRDINERKLVAKQKLKRQKEKIKQRNREEESNLRMLKEKIKKKCKGLKYYVEDGCLDY